MEMNIVPTKKLSLWAGFTIQSSKYGEAQEFNEKKSSALPEIMDT